MAIRLAGGPQVVGPACDLSHVAVYKWLRRGRMPRTEYSGETRYAQIIVDACRANDPEIRITREKLLGLPEAVHSEKAVANA